LRILFAGTPQIAVPSLEMLAREFSVVGVMTTLDKPQGRGRTVTSSPIKDKALELNLPILMPTRLDETVRQEIARLSPDILVVVAYGRIFGPKFLALFSMGGINLHPSLLPKYRGPSPISSAIFNRDGTTGVTVQEIALEVDSGNILLQKSFPLNNSETTESLTKFAAKIGSTMLHEVLCSLESGTHNSTPQDSSSASYCTHLAKKDGIIDWKKSTEEIDALIRACTPWPRGHTTFGKVNLAIRRASVYGGPIDSGKKDYLGVPGKVVDIDNESGILIQTGSGLLAVTELQLQSKKSLDWKSFLRGARYFMGAVLGL
jgi:methionyl-tRNA formyltransferase